MSRFLRLRIAAGASGGCGKGEIVQKRRVGAGCVLLGTTDRKSRCYGGDTGFGLLLTGALLAAETCEQRLFVIFGVWLGRLDPNLLQ